MSSRIGFGGGCHWCTEAVFQALRSVESVEQGFIASRAPNDSFSEAVIVTFDPEILPLEVLIEVHLRTHASTSAHKMRGKYRSAIYVFDEHQSKAAMEALQTLQSGFEENVVTQVIPFVKFKASDERFQNYYAKGPDKPFCRTYIDPKLKLLLQRFPAEVSAEFC